MGFGWQGTYRARDVLLHRRDACMMRVLHIGKFWPPYAGGIERSMRELCVGLASHGIAVDVLAHAPPGTRQSQMLDDVGVHVELAGCLGQVAYTPLSMGFVPALRRLLCRQPDLLHLHLPNPAAFWVLLLPAARRIPWVLHWHSDIPLGQAPGAVRLAYPLYRPWERALLKHATRIIATSPGYRDASEALRPWRDKTTVVPLGLAPESGMPPASNGGELWPGRGLRLLSVGRLSHYKGYDVLLRALIKAPGVQLLLIGDGECADSLHRLVAELGLVDRVRLAGALDDAQRDAAYAAAELFCLPSTARSEAFGLVLLEAMRAGVPAIASDVPGAGMRHVLDDGRAGVLVPPGDADALAADLSQLASDADRRRALTQAGHARWRRCFTLDTMIDGVRAVYAAARSGRGPANSSAT
jgi:glycosyltransferase involved in cell wall biosynthesis